MRMWSFPLAILLISCTEYGLGDDVKADGPLDGETTPANDGSTPDDPLDPNDPTDPVETDPNDPLDPVDDPDPQDPLDPNWNPDLDPDDPGLRGGHFDVDTASEIAEIGNGDTDGHVHEYDDEFNVVGVDYFGVLDDSLHNLEEDVEPTQRFRLIVANGDLSPGARIVINGPYNGDDPSTYVTADVYDDTALTDLPIYSLDPLLGIDHLTSLGIYFDTGAILDGDLIGTVTGCVRDNDPGVDDTWRNGAITLQAVEVNRDGTNHFTTDTTLSAGGVQGVATSGLLWETTIFWHWDGPCSDDPDWATHEPTF